MEIEGIIKIKIGKNTIELSYKDAMKLRDMLDKFCETRTQYVPYTPYIPWVEPYRITWPEPITISYETNTTSLPSSGEWSVADNKVFGDCGSIVMHGN